MAAQEAIHGVHNSPYVKNESPNNGYDYGYVTNEGSYSNHYNPYMHYGEPVPQHHVETSHSYDNLGQHPNYVPQSANVHENSHMHYHQPHVNSMNPYGHQVMENNVMHPSHYNMVPGQNHGMYKEEPMEDPYSFVDEDNHLHRAPVQVPPDGIKTENTLGITPLVAPKKRGRKKKIVPEMSENGEMPLGMDMIAVNSEGQPTKRKYTKSEHYKQRRRHDRFNGMTEEEVRSRILPDHLTPNLDVVIIGINPGLFAAYKGHHYAGPGNHFWKCLYLAGLVPEPMAADDDFKLLHFGIGFTNMVARATKGSADLTRKEIREGGRILLEKLQRFRPKIAVFNGKGIYEVFSGKKEFTFGKQPECIEGTNTFIWVMPSSSARCAQLPRAMDKVPFYSALKKFRDYLNGLIPEIDDSEVIFNDPKIRAADDGTEISEHLKQDLPCAPSILGEFHDEERLPILAEGIETNAGPIAPIKKKRGRPKKIRTDELNPVKPETSTPSTSSVAMFSGAPDLPNNGGPPKKKRGRPKKIRTEELSVPQVDMNGSLSSAGGSSSTNQSDQNGPPSLSPAPNTFMNQPSVNIQPNSLNQPPQLPIEFYGQSPPLGGPLSGLCNDNTTISPHASTSNHDPTLGSPPPTSSPRVSEYDVPSTSVGSLGEAPSASTPASSGIATPVSTTLGPSSSSSQMETVCPESKGDRDASNCNQFPSGAISNPNNTNHTNQQPPNTQQPLTPQPMAYRPTPPVGVGYITHNQDVASKSLSGLESLVDQIPNMNEGEHALHMHHHNQAVSNFNHYTTAQPSFSYPSTSFGHYTPHYSAPSGGGGTTSHSFPPNHTYNQGSQNAPAPMEPGFNGSSGAPATGSYPNLMSGPPGMFGPNTNSSQMNGGLTSLGHSMTGFPYSYGQYPSSATGFPYSSAPSVGVGVGFHPMHSTTYAYPTTSTAYSQGSYTQAGYLNNQVLDRLKNDRMDASSFGGY